MERPFANTHDSDQSPFEADSGSTRRPNISIAAGHIVTRGESAPQNRRPVRGAEALIAAALGQPEAPAENKNTQYSSWHRMDVDAEGKVMPVSEQHYGTEFYAQAAVEQNDPSTVSYQVPASNQTTLASPIAQPTSSPQQQTAPVLSNGVGQAYQYPQPVIPQSYTPTLTAQQDSPVMSQHPVFTAPVAQPQQLSSQPSELQLAPGASVDEQHRLPAPHPVRRFVQSPWTWLAVGLAMIFYFLV